MDKIYYNLLKNYGWNETKMEVVLFTLLRENEKFKKAFLKTAFNTKFNYATAEIEMEVSRRSLRKGRTDIEVTAKDGSKYILELKVGTAYPGDAQLEMYESIENCKEVATLTNVKADEGVRRHKNITWAETAQIIMDTIGQGPIYNFINDFGPVEGKGRKIVQPFDFDTYFTFISAKKGNYMNGINGIDIVKKYNYYIIPGPNNKIGKNYSKLSEKSEIKRLAFKWKGEDTPKGMNLFQAYEIVDAKVYLPDAFNEKMGEDIIWNKASGDKYTGPHQVLKLKPIGKERLVKSARQHLLKFYGPSKLIVNGKYDDLQKMCDDVNELKKELKDKSKL